MGPLAIVMVVIGATALVAAWAVSTPYRRDELARDFAKQMFLVDGLAEAGGIQRIRKLHPYLVRSASSAGRMLVLARDQMSAAELVAAKDGDEVAVSCLLGRHRILPSPQGRWAVAVLPSWLGFLGSTCEHGGQHE